MSSEEKLKKNFEYITSNKGKFIDLYKNKFVLVYEQEVVGAYDTYEAAAEAGINSYGINGDFLIYEMLETMPTNFLILADI